jgi:hypothetical protein
MSTTIQTTIQTTTQLINKIQQTIKQNDSIYTSFSSRKIEFIRHQIDLSDLTSKTDDELILIQNQINLENAELKDVSNKNKTPKAPIESKETKLPTQVTAQTAQTKDTKNSKKETKETDDADESFEEPVKKFTTICNMEEAKRAFFSKEYELFDSLVKEQTELKFYKVNYKYNSDKDDAPTFSAKNLVGGFVRSFDDYRKYFMICFRCFKDKDIEAITYTYPSLWIVNSLDPIQDIIGSLYDDYEFIQISDDDKEIFLTDMRKIFDSGSEQELLIEEKYVH